MGRLLAIAEAVPVVKGTALGERKTLQEPYAINAVSRYEKCAAPADPVLQGLGYDPALAAVLEILTHAAKPVPHQQVVKAMALRGHVKAAAKEAIMFCQKREWIEHNLISGYVLGESK